MTAFSGKTVGSKLADRIVVSIAPKTINELEELKPRAIEAQPLLIELRFDALSPSKIESAIKIVEDIKGRMIFTLRSKSQGGLYLGLSQGRVEDLKLLIRAKPAHIDLELDDVAHNKNLLEYARERSRILLSSHDFEKTPKIEELVPLLKKMQEYTNMIKIVTTAQQESDLLEVYELYNHAGRSQLIAFAMGEKGVPSRFACTMLGAPWTYASLDEPVAPGQMSIAKMRGIYEAFALKKPSFAQF